MKKCESCGKLAQEHLRQCRHCGAELPDYSGGGPETPAAPPPPEYTGGAAPVGVRQPGEGPVSTGPVALGDFAGFWIRFAAHLLDGVLALLITLPFGGLAAFVAISEAMAGQQPTYAADGISAIGNLLAIAFWIGNRVYLQGTRGWSIGKKVCRIVVLNEHGEVLGVGYNLLREVFKVVEAAFTCLCGLGLVGYLWMLWDDSAQALHDKITGSYVFYE